MSDLADLSGREAARGIAEGRFTSEQLVAACLERISQRESDVRAWAYLDADAALAQARGRDEERISAMAPGGGGLAALGALHGVPVGIKDIIDTADMPTQNGTPLFAGHQPEADADCVRLLREAGAVIMGKTVTTELATLTPAQTRNPHNLKHTPGGSSSGSAAAVACGMVPLALGTQTGGSVIRPASFCGIFGLKPTFGFVARSGVTLQSHTLDTVGVYGRTLDDLALLAGALDVQVPADPVSYPRGPSWLARSREDVATPSRAKFAFVRSPAWSRAEPAAQAAILELTERLGEACRQAQLPERFDEVLELHRNVQLVENAVHFAPLRARDEAALSDGLRARMREGEQVSAVAYARGLLQRDPLYRDVCDVLADTDALICLSSTGPAPASLETTGDAIFNGMWTFLGVPALTLPLLSVGGMPCGVTLVGRRRGEARLLEAARALLDVVGQNNS